LLVEVAKRLKGIVRETDPVARLGGDEFVVLLEGLGAQFDQAKEYVEAVGNKIRHALSEEYVLGEIRHHGSTGIGMKVLRGEGHPDMLLKEADAAMYDAKKTEAVMVLHG
jgi:diguanylate cyclase (GGDEF)-like protein